VVGAGPAGSAAAAQLAQAGLDVLLADRSEFPRDKVCGDGLIPDSHAALHRLGVHDEVMDQAYTAEHFACVAPRGGRVEVPGQVAVLPRRVLDHILQRHALARGARWLGGARFVEPLAESAAGAAGPAGADAVATRIVGARLRQAEADIEVHCDWLVLATGAATPPLIAAGLCERREPSAMALRGYVRAEGAAAARLRLPEVAWHRRLSGGYGWIFPCGQGVFNVGVGLSGPRASAGHVNLRQVFDTFCQVHPAAQALLAEGTALGEPKGAPLRFSLRGARASRPGLLAVGEAVGSTYALTGEGIGKALETGLAAAEALQAGGGDAAVRARYEARLDALRPRFALYEKAERLNDHPWLADLLIWRARTSARVLRGMSGVLEETRDPAALVSGRGLLKLLLPLRVS
jgi:geranylgeranyl reductase family protein